MSRKDGYQPPGDKRATSHQLLTRQLHAMYYTNAVLTALLITLIVVVIVAAVNAVPVKNVVEDIHARMVTMDNGLRGVIDPVTRLASHLVGKFPDTQPEQTTRDFVSSIEYSRQVLALLHTLMENLDTENLNAVLAGAARLSNTMTSNDITVIKAHIMGMTEKADELLGPVKSEDLAAVMHVMGTLKAELINAALQRVETLHRLTINI